MSRDIKLVLLFVPCLMWDVAFWSITWLQKIMQVIDEKGAKKLEEFLK